MIEERIDSNMYSNNDKTQQIQTITGGDCLISDERETAVDPNNLFSLINRDPLRIENDRLYYEL